MCKDIKWVAEYHYEDGDVGMHLASEGDMTILGDIKDGRGLTHVTLRRDTDEGRAASAAMHEAVNPVRRQVWADTQSIERYVVVTARTQDEAREKLASGDFETLGNASVLETGPWDYVRDEGPLPIADADNIWGSLATVLDAAWDKQPTLAEVSDAVRKFKKEDLACDCSVANDEHEPDCAMIARADMLDALKLAEATIIRLMALNPGKHDWEDKALEVIIRAARGAE